ncbi:hypothetical protein INS49_004904 [Diaporthe citri]|uniref:uncharacterized protein n=1 Tax=Diaporthe citri TaxID=83186 RepID=UPI001C81A57F|nr:uncharacterized protein INS49_004904 [Diaporthe citri]KAG6354299.1 hypothetical protein INS49_004904 [Diaporthe citri]
MTQSLPSPSDTCSNWSSSCSDFGASSSSSNTACMTSAYSDCYSTASLPVGRESRNHQQREMPGALLPSSATDGSSFEQYGGRRSTPVTSDGELKPHSPTNNPCRRRYATEDDWRGQKDRISSLYLTKRLKDVIAVMETQYQFFATERMYKARFKEWGVEKNVTAAKVHKLMQRVEEEQQRRSPSASAGRARNERVVLDVGEDLDVKRIQRYMKRKPVGLGKLRPASKRSLEVIKALSVDSGKGSSGRGKVSIPAVKLEQQNQPNSPELCLPTLASQWSPGPELPDEVVGLLQAFIDNHFDCPYPFTPMPTPTFPPLTSSKWQPQSHNQLNTIDPFIPSVGQVSRQDETMLDFVLKFRIAHTLLDDCLTSEGMHAMNACLESLAFCIQQAQNTSPMDTRPATGVILWALSAASDMMSDFKHTKKLVLQMLLQRITAFCVGHQPTMAELARRMCQLRPSGQVTMLKFARYSISQAMYIASEYQPAFETYSKTLSISESRLSPVEKLQALQRLANDPIVHDSPILGAWMEARIALSVPDASSPFIESLGSYGTTTSPAWHARGHNRMAEVLGAMAGRVEWHKAAGNWQLVQHLESRSGSIAQMVWGRTDDAAQGSGGPLDIWSSPEPMTSSLEPVEPSMFHVALPEGALKMSHLMDEIPGWGEQPQLQPQPQQQQHQGQVPVQCEPSSTSVWNATDSSQWQLDTNFESDCGMYDGLYGEWDESSGLMELGVPEKIKRQGGRGKGRSEEW